MVNRTVSVGIKKKNTNRVAAQVKRAGEMLLKVASYVHDLETKVNNQAGTISILKTEIKERRSELNPIKAALKKANKNNEILTEEISQLKKHKTENDALKREITSLKRQQNVEPNLIDGSASIAGSGETTEMEQNSDTNTGLAHCYPQIHLSRVVVFNAEAQ